MVSFHPEMINNYKGQISILESRIRDAEKCVENAREKLAFCEGELDLAIAALDTHQRLIAHMEATNAEAAELQAARAEAMYAAGMTTSPEVTPLAPEDANDSRFPWYLRELHGGDDEHGHPVCSDELCPGPADCATCRRLRWHDQQHAGAPIPVPRDGEQADGGELL